MSLAVGIVDPRRQHAGDDDGLAVERDRPADDAWIAAEARAPEPVAQERHVVAPGLMLLRQERAPERRRDAEDVEEALGHAPRVEAIGSPLPVRSTPNGSAAARSSVRLPSRQSRKLAGDGASSIPFGWFHCHSVTTRSASRYGSGCSSTPCTTLKIVVAAPMPSASVADDDERERRLADQTAGGEPHLAHERRRSARDGQPRSTVIADSVARAGARSGRGRRRARGRR